VSARSRISNLSEWAAMGGGHQQERNIDQVAKRLRSTTLQIQKLKISNGLIDVYNDKDPNCDNPDWIWQGTPERIAEMCLDPISRTAKQVPAAEIDETGRYRPEWGTGQQ